MSVNPKNWRCECSLCLAKANFMHPKNNVFTFFVGFDRITAWLEKNINLYCYYLFIYFTFCLIYHLKLFINTVVNILYEIVGHNGNDGTIVGTSSFHIQYMMVEVHVTFLIIMFLEMQSYFSMMDFYILRQKVWVCDKNKTIKSTQNH